MDLFGRYVFKQLTGAFLLVLISLTAVVWLATALRELKLLTSQGQSLLLFLKMTGLALPNLMAIIAPIALLIACFHTLNRLNTDSELIVMTASGAKIWRLAMPYLVLAVIVSLFLIAVNLWIMPKSMRLLRSYVVQVRTDLLSQVLQPGKFSSPEKGLTFHIRDRSRSGTLFGLVVYDKRDTSLIMTYLSERGEILKREKTSFLVMYNGHIQRQIAKNPAIQIVAFEKYIFDLSRFEPSKGELELKPRERYLSELLNPDPNDTFLKRHPGKFRSEIHERFASPLYPILFVLIAIALLGNARTTRQGRIHAILTGFGIATGLRVVGLASTNLLTLQASAVLLIYGIPICAILIAAIAAHVRMSPQRRSKFRLGFPSLFKA